MFTSIKVRVRNAEPLLQKTENQRRKVRPYKTKKGLPSVILLSSDPAGTTWPVSYYISLSRTFRQIIGFQFFITPAIDFKNYLYKG